MEDIAPFDVENELPHTGLLLFFFDITLVIWPDTHICHAEDIRGLKRATPPNDLSEFGVAEPFAITFSKGLSLPSAQSLEMEALFENYGSPLQETRYQEINTYGEWYWGASHYHQLLGHANYLHEDTRYLALSHDERDDSNSNERFDELQSEAQNWRLLLQFGSESEIEGTAHEIQWGNKNCIHLLIRDSDLKARNFSRVYEFS